MSPGASASPCRVRSFGSVLKNARRDGRLGAALQPHRGPGSLSRLLRSLEAAGVVKITASDADRRIRVARLTDAGRRERAVLDERSDQRAQSLLEPLSAPQRGRLVAAMHDIERLLTAASVELKATDPEHIDAVKHHADAPAEIKRMWIAPTARGLGLGRRLLERLEACARAGGASVAHIETSAVLTEALALYRSAGWAEVPAFNDEPFADHWLEKTLV